jgi:hypothetical protein
MFERAGRPERKPQQSGPSASEAGRCPLTHNDEVVLCSLSVHNGFAVANMVKEGIDVCRTRYEGKAMRKDAKTSTTKNAARMPDLPMFPPTDPHSRASKLLSICVDLLELCIETTSTIALFTLSITDGRSVGAYAAQRSELAKSLGLGRRTGMKRSATKASSGRPRKASTAKTAAAE